MLIRDDPIADVAAILRIPVELDDVLPEQFAPASAIEPTDLVCIGQRSGLTSNRRVALPRDARLCGNGSIDGEQ